MAYDPCLPKPATIVHAIAKANPHHHIPKGHHLLGRRVSRWYGNQHMTQGCPKFGRALRPPRRLTIIVAKLASPSVLTAAGVAVVGASAFHGVSVLQGFTDPIGTVPVGGIVTPSGPHPARGGPGTSVPEPGTAAILAVAMIVVVVSSWVQGSRAFRSTPESHITAVPLPGQPKKS